MNRRSRSGCIECRRSKIKCDERKPYCGTCARRGRKCCGYPVKHGPKPLKWTANNDCSDGPPRKRRRSSQISLDDEAEVSYGIDSYTHYALASSPAQDPSAHRNLAATHHGSPPGDKPDWQLPCKSQLLPSLLRELSTFASSEITPEIANSIAMYFARHPTELVIGSEPAFIAEMNAYVLQVLHSNVEAVGIGLCAIGSVYLQNQGSRSGLELALGSRIKTLATIRSYGSRGFSGLTIEQAMSMILALVSMELIDQRYKPDESPFKILHSVASAMIHHHISKSLAFSSTAKYLIRALAREDMIMALVQRRSVFIPTSVWLDEDCTAAADRFMGFTMTLMPLLEELAELADTMNSRASMDIAVETTPHTTAQAPCSYTNIHDRFSSLECLLLAWKPPLVPDFSGASSRKFILQAAMYRSAAQLYLYRLQHPPGCSAVHDMEALAFAYDIFAHLSGEPRDNRLVLFPVFIAACEFLRIDDRAMAVEAFNSIYESRNTQSTWVTRNFVRDRVWGARDNGWGWNWMELVKIWPGECIPI